VIFVVHPVFHVITAALPSSFQVPVIPSPRVAFATPPLDKVISKGCPAVSFTFHTPSNALAARLARLVIPKKQAAVTAVLIAFLIIVTPPNFPLGLETTHGTRRFHSTPSHQPHRWTSSLAVLTCPERSARLLCCELKVNLAYRWFCGLSIEDKIPDHSAF
jgi:Transposase domain (DUF772)